MKHTAKLQKTKILLCLYFHKKANYTSVVSLTFILCTSLLNMFAKELFVDPESGSPNCSSKSYCIIRKQKSSRPKQEILPSFHCGGSTPLSSWSAITLFLCVPESFPRYRNWESQFLQRVIHRIMECGGTLPSGMQGIRTALRKNKFYSTFCMSPSEILKKVGGGECCKEIIVSWETYLMVGST